MKEIKEIIKEKDFNPYFLYQKLNEKIERLKGVFKIYIPEKHYINLKHLIENENIIDPIDLIEESLAKKTYIPDYSEYQCFYLKKLGTNKLIKNQKRIDFFEELRENFSEGFYLDYYLFEKKLYSNSSLRNIMPRNERAIRHYENRSKLSWHYYELSVEERFQLISENLEIIIKDVIPKIASKVEGWFADKWHASSGREFSIDIGAQYQLTLSVDAEGKVDEYQDEYIEVYSYDIKIFKEKDFKKIELCKFSLKEEEDLQNLEILEDVLKKILTDLKEHIIML